MKLAVISDVHGNVAALDAVLRDARARQADQIVNLGDICSGALFPRETADRLMALDLPTIRGNHERQLLTVERSRQGLSDGLATDTLRPEQLAWLSKLPATLRVSGDVLLVHGTPSSDLAYFLHTVTENGVRPATAGEIEQRAGEIDASLILCGHTHLQASTTLADGRMIVNPGSVGLPAFEGKLPFPHVVESGSPHARYAMLERADRRWAVDFLMVEYDWAGAARHAEAHGRDDWSKPLRTGYV